MNITLTIINPGFVRTAMTEKNKFPMPFLVEPEQAAKIVIEGLARKKYEIAFPWQLVWLVKFMRLLPYPIFFWIVRKSIMAKDKKQESA